MRLPIVVMKMLLHVDDFKITACVIQIIIIIIIIIITTIITNIYTG